MIADERALEDMLSKPCESTCRVLAETKGDFLVLGAGGKMGPTLAMMLRKGAPGRKVFAVSRYSDRDVKARIEERGVETIEADLLDESIYADLPDAPNVFFLAGMKFGATGNQPLTWAMNVYVPALVARRYARSRIVVLSTGNVYRFTDANGAGSREDDVPGPVGEYAQSCLGRERMFQYFSQVHGTAVTLIRLNYANEPRYGIIVDLASRILQDQPIDVTMGFVNLIWQGDANNYIARSLSLAARPPAILNVAGPEVVRVRDVAERIGRRLGREPRFVSHEAETALLSDSSLCVERFGPPATSLDEMIEHIVDWVAAGKAVLNKPTKYDVRDGKF
ncbi:MAG TPA: NAD(P)-dependent oxidoreductase [Sedimentisphaerales bacterium]|nr:NAD(P)-dependent oxidoreductase [Sedimentisphaerales bacterium]HRS10043.1 NAD(P)-dependent oxidoreductase [Sedimentisphaerales bacterium]HRV46749.1 NAD(P)-dependent oxidoreductase [Sedimentisphaerales bacterium]